MNVESLDAETFARIDEVLEEVLDLEPAGRAAVLEAQPEQIRRWVEHLLAQDEGALDSGRWAFEGLDPEEVLGEADLDRLPFHSLGPYRLVGSLGRGGMGTVFRAVRSDGAYEDEVAVKVLRRGLDTEDIVRRFVTERQLLARLDHPAITRVLDGGTTPDGRPWFVMELVRGEPIDAWARRTGASLRVRLELFARVCDAVHYAHQRLVVHRDLKPGHVLVTPAGDPRLLDFGLAKLLDPDDDDDLTRTAERWLTPGWAAPEQRRGAPVTTAADVYALGAILFTLVAGRRPQVVLAADSGARDGAERESVTGPELPSSSRPADEALPYPRSALRGDLDAIVAQAMASDPSQRYPSAGALAADLRRYFTGEPVVARRLGPVQVALRLLHRHRAAAAVGAGFLALLAGWGVTATVQATRLASERDRAQHAAEVADREARRAERTASFLESMLTAADPRVAVGEELTAREILLAATREVDRSTELAEDPILAAELRLVIGRSLIAVEESPQAVPVLQRAVQDLERVAGPEAVETARIRTQLGLASKFAGHREEAREQLTRALAAFRGAPEALPRDLAQATQALSSLELEDYERLDEARALAEEAVSWWRRDRASSVELARALSWLAYAYARQGYLGPAREAVDEALAMIVAHRGEDHPDVAEVLHHKIALTDDSEEQLALRQRQLAIYERVYDRPNMNLAGALNDFGLALEPRDPEGAAEALQRSVEVASAALAPDHPKRLAIETNYGAVLRDQGRLDEAASVLESVYERAAARGEPDRMEGIERHLGELRQLQGRHAEALRHFDAALAALARSGETEGPRVTLVRALRERSVDAVR